MRIELEINDDFQGEFIDGELIDYFNSKSIYHNSKVFLYNKKMGSISYTYNYYIDQVTEFYKLI